MKSLTNELWRAVIECEYDLAACIIYRGADVNLRSAYAARLNLSPTTTLLHLAMSSGNVQFARLLIKHGANCNARNVSNRTPLHLAALNEYCPDIVEELINGGAIVDAQDDEQNTPLHLAVIHGSNEMALKLIARGASIETVDRGGQNLLHLASLNENLTMVKLLISYKINIDAQDYFGNTPLHNASYKCTDITKILLDNGADMEKKSQRGLLPLHLAAMYCPASLHSLLKHGARINEITTAGNTALHLACENEIAESAALLLKFGADLNARNPQGKTPFELLPNRPSSEATARVVIREAVKREALGEPLCEEYIKMAQSRENYSIFDQQCHEEVKRMESERIDVEDSAVSFIKILLMNEEKAAVVARNQKIVAAVEKSLESFTIYRFDLIAKFQMAKRRANFLIRVEDFLMDEFGDILPAPIVQKLAVYVKDDDMKYIIKNE